MYILCILSINRVYIVFTAVLMGLGEILVKNFNIQIQYKLFCVVFFFHT